MKTKEQIEEFLENELSESELISVWNEYCEANSYFDDELYDMCMFDDFLGNCTPTEVLESVSSDFNIRHNYFYCDVYGYESCDYAEDHVEFSDLAKYIHDNEDSLGCDDLEDFMHEDEEEEE